MFVNHISRTWVEMPSEQSNHPVEKEIKIDKRKNLDNIKYAKYIYIVILITLI